MDVCVFADAVAAVSQGVLVCDSRRRIMYSNPAFTDITGYDVEELSGRDCKMLQGRDTDPSTIAAIRAALASGEYFSGEILNYRKNGEPFWNDLAIAPVRGAGGQLDYFIGITRDLTARKVAEARLAALDEQYRFLFDHALAGIVMHDARTAIVYINARAASLLGMTQEEAIGAVAEDPRWGFLHEDGSPLPIDDYPVRLALAKRKVESMVVGKQRAGEREPVWLMCTAYPALEAADQPARIVVTFTDISDLKRAERALNASEERLRLILRGANDAAWDWNLLTGDVYLSPRWWEMIGYEPDELSGFPDTWKRLMHPRDRRRVRDAFDHALAHDAETYGFEFRLRHKAGHYVPLLTRGFIMRDPNGVAIRVSGTNTDLTERRAADSRIHRLAFYDVLTGLPNRSLMLKLLQDTIAESRQSKQWGALLFIDIDHFKMLNDTRGHDMGDVLVRQMARRLRQCVGSGGVVGRLGGDEFLVILKHLGFHAPGAEFVAQNFARKIQDTTADPYRLGKLDYRCTLSIGIAPFDGLADDGVDSIRKQADIAMYAAKAAGRNTLRVFSDAMQVAVDQRLQMENDLRIGLQAQQMVLYAQPQVDRAGNTLGAELLVRWCHPSRGLVPPGEFIPLAEATGLILPLGRWVLRSACEHLACWAHDPRLAQLSLSVNVSVRQFHEEDFAAGVLDALADTGANPARLKLEMTETIFAENFDDIVAKMRQLRAAGIAFSIDDFGTGYSSLKYLQRMPLDELKIDGSFVGDVLSNANDAAIARIIISLADNLGISVVAEGVETAGQMEFLASEGCRKFQGYLFGKPRPMPEFEAAMVRV